MSDTARRPKPRAQATMRRVRLGEAIGTVEAVRGRVADVLWDTGARCPVPLAWLSDAPGCAQCGGPWRPNGARGNTALTPAAREPKDVTLTRGVPRGHRSG
jgi:hypothetical protein